ncbi:MAG TPA: acetoacetate--CoA ligase [Solirubrobacteraceae bacterium]|jgi:acetoacetyl-CoA synthetase|nr:acetoacetate--CoA ligase [Solirubrobacteraceae bacterium]
MSREREAPLWEPTARERERAHLTDFMRWAGAREGRTFGDYEQLRRWSVEEIERFWEAVWDYFGVLWSRPYLEVVDARTMPGACWFGGAELNYAENILCDRSGETRAFGAGRFEDASGASVSPSGPPFGQHPRFDRSRETRVDLNPRFGQRAGRPRDPGLTAVLHASELRELGELSWGELAARVAAVAGGLRALGVGRGDRVVAYLPNIPETLIAFLATASIGAIWSSAAPEFGARSVVDRFGQIEPKVLLAIDGYRHGGKDFDRRAVVGEIVAELPTVEHAVLVPYLFAHDPPSPATPAGGAPTEWPGALTWDELCERGEGAPLQFEQVPFEHPLWVLYSSGTTGLPKAIVHGHGGILLEQLKKSHLHLDLHAGDRMFWFTTTGWMMWNFLLGCLFTDAAIVLYDGSPGSPDMGAMWRLAERTRMSCMGVSAGLLSACEQAGVRPARDFDLSALRSIGATGSPLAPESFAWVYKEVKPDVWLFSTSGGTDVCTAFVGGCPLLPVYEGELQCRCLGCAVEAWDERGRSVVDEVGELVLTEPLPSMPLCFWNDPPGGASVGAQAADASLRQAVGPRYRESYFSMYPGVWRHGDWIRITARGGAVIYGRSDATINRQGVRMGTSEIYRAAGAVEEVVDALVVDIPARGDRSWETRAHGAGRSGDASGASVSRIDPRRCGQPAGAGGVAGAQAGTLEMWLFVVLRPGVTLDEELKAAIKRRIREDCSPRHVPDEVLQIEEVPRTLSGKTLEVPVKRIMMGAAPAQAASVDSLANPRALDYFVRLAQTLR